MNKNLVHFIVGLNIASVITVARGNFANDIFPVHFNKQKCGRELISVIVDSQETPIIGKNTKYNNYY